MPNSDSGAPVRRTFHARIGIAGVLLVVAATAAVVVGLRFINSERERDLMMWQTRLGIVADSRAAAVTDWVKRQYAPLSGLAENASLQIYMTELVAHPDDPNRAGRSLAESGYLRNLLTVIADRSGFRPRSPQIDVAANVRRAGTAGIALVRNGQVIVSTATMPPVDARIAKFLADAPAAAPALLDLYIGSAGTPTMAFAVPIFAIQGRGEASRQLGWALGIKEVASELYPLLHQPGSPWRTGEGLLIRRNGAIIEFLSPTRTGDAPLTRSLSVETPHFVDSALIDRPGDFLLGRDYQGHEVLATGRRIAGTPWTLVYQIDRSEALGDSDARLSRLTIGLVLVVAAFAAALIAAWWYGSTRRAEDATMRFRDLARRFEAQSRLLKVVTDSQTGPMFVIDNDTRFRFANRATADRAGISVDDLMGKTLKSVFGPAEADRYVEANEEALTLGERVVRVHQTGLNGSTRILQAAHIPVVGDPSVMPPGVMVVEEDVTEAIGERERRERTLQALIETVVTVIDSRDPNAGRHSSRVASVAKAIAEEMRLETALVRTAETAGQLMNIGKIMVPDEMLTRNGALDEEERRLVRFSIQRGADLLKKVEFDGPVVETIRQMHEHWDGTGEPEGLVADDILFTAQIISVANAFVALASPRAWRKGLEIDDAFAHIAEKTGTVFSPRVVTALRNLIENRGARETWKHFAALPGALPSPGAAADA